MIDMGSLLLYTKPDRGRDSKPNVKVGVCVYCCAP